MIGLLEAVATANRPQQIEYARLAIEHTVLSKRLLAKLVDGGHVNGWDDPRLPTLFRSASPEATRPRPSAIFARVSALPAKSL